MTKSTAQFLIKEMEQIGIHSAIDNDYFILSTKKNSGTISNYVSNSCYGMA